MLKLIIEKEIRDIIGSTKFIITFAVCAVFVILSFYSGVANYKTSMAQYEAAKAENIRQIEGLTDWFEVQSTRIFLPPQPLAVLVSGVSNDIGRTTEVEGRGDLVALDSKYGEEPIFATFRFLDLEFLFQVVLSLFAILLGFDSISGEKERGTLRLTFANAVPRATYILGKLTGSALALAVPLSCPIAIGALLLPIFGIPMAGSDWGRLALVVLVGMLYLTALLSLSILVSAMTHRSSNSFLILLLIWIGSVMIIPRAAVVLAGRAVTVPSLDEINTQKAKFATQLFAEDRKNMLAYVPTKSSSEGGCASTAMTEFNQFMETLADERDQKKLEFGGRLDEERFNRQRQQERWGFNLARFSPAASLSLAMSAFSGTSLDLKNNYHNNTLAYQQSFAQFQKEKLGTTPFARMRRMTYDSNASEKEKPKPINTNELPVFDFKPISLSASIAAAIVDTGLLVLFNLIFFAGAFAAFLRYDFR
jgi:ABC-type transport system involved in multi-copper enzyme maturation permease subunit